LSQKPLPTPVRVARSYRSGIRVTRPCRGRPRGVTPSRPPHRGRSPPRSPKVNPSKPLKGGSMPAVLRRKGTASPSLRSPLQRPGVSHRRTHAAPKVNPRRGAHPRKRRKEETTSRRVRDRSPQGGDAQRLRSREPGPIGRRPRRHQRTRGGSRLHNPIPSRRSFAGGADRRQGVRVKLIYFFFLNSIFYTILILILSMPFLDVFKGSLGFIVALFVGRNPEARKAASRAMSAPVFSAEWYCITLIMFSVFLASASLFAVDIAT